MKNLKKLSLLLLLTFFTTTLVNAQGEERNKIVMSIVSQGKTVTAELSTVSFGISRYSDYSAPAQDVATATTTKDKTAIPERGSYYLATTVKKVDAELLKVFAKKNNRFNGTITVTDTYGKNPPREIKFTNAALDSYSDQFTSASYDDSYSVASVVFSTTGLTVNGVVLE